MNEHHSFNRQKIYIRLNDISELKTVSEQISKAHQSYRRLYPNETEHAILLSIQLPLSYNQKVVDK